ncbi:MAG: efflux RND transporter permease subunit [Rhodospirillales bacterium]|nr:efflux RND transporter permease subunit [Rhodospirillales bacterium]
MIVSDVSVKRPVFASVISLLLIAFGLVAFDRLPLREYPDIDPPVVSISTSYPGAAANVVETRITEVIEDRISGIQGIKFINSTSEDGRSRITIEFDVGRDVDAAANDIRDRVAGVLDDLPDEADPPDIQKADSNDDVIMWLNLASDRMNVLELTDYARRYLVDRFSALDGVARVRVGGGLNYAMRIWLDRTALAARGLTVGDVEDALRADNVELPAGSIESRERQLTVRVQRTFRTPEDFQQLVLGQGDGGYLVRLGDVARVERGAVEDRTFLRGNGVPMVGIGIIKQSQANTLQVARDARGEAERLNQMLPEGMQIRQSYDTSVFIQGAIDEVYKTLFIAIAAVVLVIFLFLGSVRAMLVPAVAVPVSLIATFIVLYGLGFSINLLTLLALVLAIGLVVDDAIVVLENIHRRMDEGETPLVAAFNGARQVAFAVVATTLVLIAVFVPIAFLQGDVGRLFTEFALTMAAAVAFSSIVALTLSPMLASQILRPGADPSKMSRAIEHMTARAQRAYRRALSVGLHRPIIIAGLYALILAGAGWMFMHIPSEHAPKEDRGAFFLIVSGPEGASYDYMVEYMDEIERRLMPLVESGEVSRMLVRAPRQFGDNVQNFNGGIAIFVLDDWGKRRTGGAIMEDVQRRVADLPGIRAYTVMRQGFGARIQKPVQFVIGGGTYGELAEWRDILLAEIEKDNPGLKDIDYDYKETKPQVRVVIDRDSAGDLGVTIGNIGRTLETVLGSRRVTTYIADGEEYDVILEGERDAYRTPASLEHIYVRSERSGALIPLASVVRLEEFADSPALNRYNRVRAITIEAGLVDGYTLGEALDYLQELVREHLPESAVIDFKGQSRDYYDAGGSIAFVFVLGLVVVFLVLAAQFESYVHPFIIMLSVPLAMAGALLALLVTGGTINLFSQIGLVMLVGLAAKNGILIVEFANQLRDQGVGFDDALMEAAVTRLRPILMTAVTTAVGAIPLILSTGAGAETRAMIGTVVFSGIIVATLFTLFVVPVAYHALARRTGSPGHVAARLERELAAETEPEPLQPSLSERRSAAE